MPYIVRSFAKNGTASRTYGGYDDRHEGAAREHHRILVLEWLDARGADALTVMVAAGYLEIDGVVLSVERSERITTQDKTKASAFWRSFLGTAGAPRNAVCRRRSPESRMATSAFLHAKHRAACGEVWA